jgi:hypothetical protein
MMATIRRFRNRVHIGNVGEEGVKADPGDAPGHYGFGSLLRRAGLRSEAAEQFRTAYEMDLANVTYRGAFEAAAKH